MFDVKDVYLRCEQKWGRPSQIMMLIEEMAELTKALSKLYRAYNEQTEKKMIEEIADVSIMVEQITTIFNLSDRVEEQRKTKLTRLLKMLND